MSSCPIRSLGLDPELVLSLFLADSHILFLSLFPGPELPKPEVISQLEQGTELWAAERGIAQGYYPGEICQMATPKGSSPGGDSQEEMADVLVGKSGVSRCPAPPKDPVKEPRGKLAGRKG